jgi:uncharacterized protein (TIGR03437 family)
MIRHLLGLILLAGGIARAASPSYTALDIVNAGNYTAGPFAPGSVLSLFGTSLSTAPRALMASDIRDGQLPVELNWVRVYVDNAEMPLFYVSETQINFMLPMKQGLGPAKVRVARQGLSGPEVTITVVAAAPALFVDSGGFVIATHGDNSLITRDAPAGGEIIVIYATGLGKLDRNPDTGQIPQSISRILAFDDLKVTVGSRVISGDAIKYAGLTPGSAGLYQINVELPGNLGADSELRVSIGSASTPAGVKLATR